AAFDGSPARLGSVLFWKFSPGSLCSRGVPEVEMKYKTILAFAAIFLFCLAGLNLAASRSDVADAAMKGDKAAVRALLERKADVNAPQVDGAVALHWAVYKDDIELADMLLGAGAKADVVNREGITPLHMASLYGDVKDRKSTRLNSSHEWI